VTGFGRWSFSDYVAGRTPAMNEHCLWIGLAEIGMVYGAEQALKAMTGDLR